MSQKIPNRSLGLCLALLAALLSLAPVSSTFAGNGGGDSEEDGTPTPDKDGQDGDEIQ